MKMLASKVFDERSLPLGEDYGDYNLSVPGVSDSIGIFISEATIGDDNSIIKAAAFLDKIEKWNNDCRKIFLETENAIVKDYFEFYLEEVPHVFETENPSQISTQEMINKLKLNGVASHVRGAEQSFNVDFTLGYDQLLVMNFDADFSTQDITWES